MSNFTKALNQPEENTRQKSRSLCNVERKVASSSPAADEVFLAVFSSIAIMLYSAHVPILFLVCIIVIAIVAACLIGKLFWSFHFRNKGLEPI